MQSHSWVKRFSGWLAPRVLQEEGVLWRWYVWLFYLIYLFLPFFWSSRGHLDWLWPTLASLPVFLAVYMWQVHLRRRTVTGIVLIALLSYLVTPANPAAFTYLTYACILAPFVVRGLPRALLVTLALLVIQTIEIYLLHQPSPDVAIAVLICVVSCIASHFGLETARKNAALRLSQAQVRSLATVAERERIGRDLHDLLGHTLSLIALKSELAGKLLERDRGAAAAEIADVTRVARDALRQVRSAVAGIRSAGLAQELASARALLVSAAVELECRHDGIALPIETETALAMIVREAVTNIQRHAGATRARIEVARTGAGVVELLISDDGRGGASVHGNGLAGIAERVHSLGGTLQIDSARGEGTSLRVSLPFVPYPTQAAVAGTERRPLEAADDASATAGALPAAG
ncbi:MAG: sensor histidine kinase [Steroidobacteraceae bacterium]